MEEEQNTTSGYNEDQSFFIADSYLLLGWDDATAIGPDLLVVDAGSSETVGTAIREGEGFRVMMRDDYFGTVQLRFTVLYADPGRTDSTNLSFDILPVNDLPAGTPPQLPDGGPGEIYTVSEGTLLAGITDRDGDSLTVERIAVTDATGRNLGDATRQEGDGTATWTIAVPTDAVGPITLAYTVGDGSASVTFPATFGLTAAPPPPPPPPPPPVDVTVKDDKPLPGGTEDAARVLSRVDLIGVLDNPSGLDLTLVDVRVRTTGGLAPDWARIVGDGVEIVPAPDFNGAVLVDYTLRQPDGRPITVTRTMMIEPVNDAPAGQAGIAVPPGRSNVAYTLATATLLAGFADADGDALSLRSVAVSGGTVATDPGGNLTISPPTNFVGTLTLSFEVSDGKGGTITGSTAITFDPGGIIAAGTAGNDRLAPDATRSDQKSGSNDDTLSGYAGNDILDGASGADLMFGGAGNDLYLVDNAGDVVVEDAATGGMDTVSASIAFTLGDHLEHLILTGSAPIDGFGSALANRITGNGAANRIEGFAGNDTLVGGDGADRLSGSDGRDDLDGGRGRDELRGGSGDDTYRIGDALDRIVEANVASGGVDLVVTSVGYRLVAGLENLILAGTGAINGVGNGATNGLTGNTAANRLWGLDGNDRLVGGRGADTLSGGRGDDVLTGGSGFDRFVFQRGDGSDRIKDFEPGRDRIDLTAFKLKGFDALVIKDLGAFTLIDLPGADRITLDLADPRRLSSEDFVF